MKKYYKILFVIICIFFMISNVNAKTLKQLREELAKDEARQAELIAEQKAKQKKIDAANKEIGSLAGQINSKENKVEAAKTEIEELEGQIEEKKKEIDNLLSFLQISSKENVYLEYVFQAKIKIILQKNQMQTTKKMDLLLKMIIIKINNMKILTI